MNQNENDWKEAYIRDYEHPKFYPESWITGYEIRRLAETILIQVEVRYVPDVSKPYDNIVVGIFSTSSEVRIWTILAEIINEEIDKHEELYSILIKMIDQYNNKMSFIKHTFKLKKPYSWKDMQKICTSELIKEKLIIVKTPIFS